MTEESRNPDWQKWGQIPSLKLWEAVALSLDIDPKKVKTNKLAWMGADHPFAESSTTDDHAFTESLTFDDRLEILRRNVGGADGLKAEKAAHWYNATVNSRAFAAWAKKSNWDAPPELFALFATPAKQGDAPLIPIAVPDYLDRTHHRYAPKLAAAVRAWEAVTSENGTKPKKALENWLRAHAREFGNSPEKALSNQAIDECAKVANWNPGGGAPKTLEK